MLYETGMEVLRDVATGTTPYLNQPLNQGLLATRVYVLQIYVHTIEICA